MSNFIRVLRARSLKKKFRLYEEEKILALNPDEKKKSKKTFRKKKRGLVHDCLKRFTDKNTFEGFAIRSFLGFICGVGLTYLFFLFFVIGINLPIFSAFYMCAVMGVVFSIGLAFSKNVRCYVLLLLPIFFSKQGRQVLMGYAFLLALTGPARNTLRNMGILSDSLSCGQEQLRKAVRHVVDLVKSPFKAIKESIIKTTKSVKAAVEPLEKAVSKIKQVIFSVFSIINAATSWLENTVNICNEKLGTPYERCVNVFDGAVQDCKATLGMSSFLCNVAQVITGLCYFAKGLDGFCTLIDFETETAISTSKKRLREFTNQMKNLLYVSLEFSQFSESDEEDTEIKDISHGIFKEIRERASRFHSLLSGISCLFGLLFFVLFIKVLYYKYKFFSSDVYDNRYINKYINEIDIRRLQLNKETVLPLEPREKRHFTTATSIWLLDVEKRLVTRSLFFLTLTTFKIFCVLFCDYFLYWLLMLIRHGGQQKIPRVKVGGCNFHVVGEGIITDLYRNLINALKIPDDPKMNLDSFHCLPDPLEPDIPRYCQIGFLTFVCWLLTLTEPYGLRLRNVIMSHYYPNRAKERAVWLYNHILRSRGGFLKFARRQLRRTYQKNHPGKMTFMERLSSNCPLVNLFLSKKKEKICLLCCEPETPHHTFKTCKTPDCMGRYCLSCYGTLQNFCTICQHPLDYGDFSDISEEKDSSDECSLCKDERSQIHESPCVEAHKTYKDVESREKFRDIEWNGVRDSVSIIDLSSPLKKRDKMVMIELKEDLKKVLKKKLKDFKSQNRSSKEKFCNCKLQKRKESTRLRAKTILKRFLKKSTGGIKEESSQRGLISDGSSSSSHSGDELSNLRDSPEMKTDEDFNCSDSESCLSDISNEFEIAHYKLSESEVLNCPFEVKNEEVDIKFHIENEVIKKDKSQF